MLVVVVGQRIMWSLCHKHSRHLKKAALGRAIWIDLACKIMMKASLVKHGQSESHSTAVKMEADLCSCRGNGEEQWPSNKLF